MRFNICGVSCSLTLTVLLMSPGQIFGDLVAHWSFDTDYTEDTGAHHGTLVDTNTIGNSKLDTTVKQFGDGSLQLSSDRSDYVNIPNSITLSHDNNGYSIAFWAKKNANNNDSMVLGDRLADPSYIWLQTQDKIFFRTGTSDSQKTTSKYALTSDTGWHHIVIVNDGTSSNNMTFYVDNTSATQTGGTGTHIDAFIVNTIGDAWGNNKWAYNGHIDEVWIFDHAIEPNIVGTLFESNSIPEPSYIGLLTIGGIIAITWRHRRRWGHLRQ